MSKQSIAFGLLSVVVVLAVAGPGCSGCDECTTSRDCGTGNVCVSGVCHDDGAGYSTDSETDSETGIGTESETASETETGTVTEQPSETETESETESETETGSASETEGTDPLPDGAVCTDDSECASDHCGDGFCCAAGECCATPGDPADCDLTGCVERFCDGNFQCQYENLPCGGADLDDGDVCWDGERCDGSGTCVTVEACSGAYAENGLFTCTPGAVTAACHTTCEDEEQCLGDNRCAGEACVPRLANGAGNCTSDLDCTSGHCYTATGICCADGACCDDNTDCAPFSCDLNSFSCNGTCNAGGVEEDGPCGDGRHCDGYSCLDDLLDGEYWCDEDSDCASGSCDDATGVCCTGLHCCLGDGDCAGFACDESATWSCAETCAPAGSDDDALCAPEFHCADGACLPDIQNGFACTADADCVAGHCGDGFCCAEGECCAQASDCDTSTCVARSCAGTKKCAYVNMACGAADTGDGGTCLGASRCNGAGACTAVTACAVFAPSAGYDCPSGDVVQRCKTTCGDDDDCATTHHCDAPACVLDLANGASGCDSDFDCASGFCNPFSTVCCEAGYCCNDTAQCGSLGVCDDEEFFCTGDCDAGGGDDDALCAPMGDFHCDGGFCRADIANGGGTCNEDGDCLSNHCTLATGLCCAAGTCCADGTPCGGATCDLASHACVVDCSPGGVETDALCQDGYHCDGDSCVADAADGDGCDEASDCLAGHCGVNGFCCEDGGGECCATDLDCDDGDDCTNDACGAGFQCGATAKLEGELCSDGIFCNGVERCLSGVCTAGAGPCDHLDTFCRNPVCNEGGKSCDWVADKEGLSCGPVEFCIGNIPPVCVGGLCVDPGTGTVPCGAPTGNPCTVETCDEGTNSCVESPVEDEEPCDDSDPCNGEDACQDGVCVHAGNPCLDINPCTLDVCTPSGNTPVCDVHTPIADFEDCALNPCAGDLGYCLGGECMPPDVRACDDGNLCTPESCAIIGGFPECNETLLPSYVLIECGEATAVVTEDFSSREAYVYNATCAGDHPGYEAQLELELAVAGNVTISLSAITPAGDVDVLRLADPCLPASCTHLGTNGLTAALAAGTHHFVLEAPDGPRPTSVTVTVSCP